MAFSAHLDLEPNYLTREWAKARRIQKGNFFKDLIQKGIFFKDLIQKGNFFKDIIQKGKKRP